MRASLFFRTVIIFILFVGTVVIAYFANKDAAVLEVHSPVKNATLHNDQLKALLYSGAETRFDNQKNPVNN